MDTIQRQANSHLKLTHPLETTIVYQRSIFKLDLSFIGLAPSFDTQGSRRICRTGGYFAGIALDLLGR